MKKILALVLILSTVILAKSSEDTLTLKNYIKLFSNTLNINVLIPKNLENREISFYINKNFEKIEKDIGMLSDVLNANNLILSKKENYYVVIEKDELAKNCTYIINNSSFKDIENYFTYQKLEHTIFKDSNIVYFRTLKNCFTHIYQLKNIDKVLENKKLTISLFQNDVTKNNEKDINFDSKYLNILNPFSITPDTSFIYNTKDYSSFLNYVDKNSNVEIKHSPTFQIFNNKDVVFNSYQDIPYSKTVTQLDKDNTNKTVESTEFKKVGIDVQITPKFLKSGSVFFELTLSLSNFIDFDKKGIPTTYTNYIKTSFVLKANEMFVLTGLNNETNKNVLSYPLLSKVPLVGSVFEGYVKEKKNFHLSLVVKLSNK